MNKKLKNELFWRDLLCKYVAHITDVEGFSCLGPSSLTLSVVKFTQIELVALRLAETKAEELLREIEYEPQPASAI